MESKIINFGDRRSICLAADDLTQPSQVCECVQNKCIVQEFMATKDEIVRLQFSNISLRNPNDLPVWFAIFNPTSNTIEVLPKMVCDKEDGLQFESIIRNISSMESKRFGGIITVKQALSGQRQCSIYAKINGVKYEKEFQLENDLLPTLKCGVSC